MNLKNAHVDVVKILNLEKHLTGILMEILKRRKKCLGKVVGESRNQFQQIIHDLGTRGVEGVILGCTEISLLINQEDSPLPLFDTTAIHAKAAVSFALEDG